MHVLQTAHSREASPMSKRAAHTVSLVVALEHHNRATKKQHVVFEEEMDDAMEILPGLGDGDD